MVNRAVIGILVFLMLIVGGLCYYTYTLNQQIFLLSERLIDFQQEQAIQINNLSNELNNDISKVSDEINSVSNEFNSALNSFRTLTEIELWNLEKDISGATTKIDTLEEELEDVTAEVSQAIAPASAAYEKANQAVVRISNGERTIGSGFLSDDKGHVITAYHVVENLSDKYVVFPDGSVSLATTAGVSQQSDIAVLTLSEKPSVQPLALADSSAVKIGQPVISIGTPFDLNETLTYGIVSQTDRFIEIESTSGSRWVANLIQFDAPVNPGNSGGPLINTEGEVIGMVIARVRPDEGDGIYYAVSSNKIKRVSAVLIEKGSYDYPWLGVEVSDITPKRAQDKGLETTNGALVNGISGNGPADKAEVKVGDVIIAIDETAINEVADLTSYLGEYKSPGDSAALTVIRNSSTIELDVETGKRP